MNASAHQPSATALRRWGFAALALMLIIVLAACAGGAAAPVGDNLTAGGDGQPDALSDRSGSGDEDAAPPFADLADRQIVKTGEVTIEVESVAAAVGAVRAMALELGGYVGASRSGGIEEPASLTLRIPAERFDAAISRLHEMQGEVVVEATREEDVTSSVVDLEARIRNLQASETQYRVLLERATEIEDILTVQSRLDDVRGRIEQLQAQLEQLSGQATMATLTVTLLPAASAVDETTEGWDAGAIFESAVAALVGLGQAAATVLIWLGIVGLPLALIGVVLLALALRLAPITRRQPAGPGGATSEAPSAD